MSADAGIRVRRAQVGEPLDSVARLQNLAFTRPWSAEAIGWELRETEAARLYVLERETPTAGTMTLVAYCACWLILDELHINSLAVAPDARRCGHARRLLVDVFLDVGLDGVTSATLEVRRSNAAALALYTGLGFQVDAVRPGYYQHPTEDALILWHRGLATLGLETDLDRFRHLR